MALALLGLTSCIQRDVRIECVPESGAEVTDSSGSTAAKKTGNWGKVPGVSVLPAEGLKSFVLHGETGRVERSTYDVDGQAFTEATRLAVKEASRNTWDVQLQVPNATAVSAGDVMLASFYFRTEWAPNESAEGQTEFVFELAKDPWTKSVSEPVRASREWKQFLVGFTAAENYAAGEAQMIFRLGYSPETIDIADVKVENFGKQLTLADLPTTGITYDGIEADAPWRAAAAQRIEQNRKGTLQVLVQDASGAPVPNAEVHAVLVNHAFGFGTASPASRLASDGEPTFKRKITDYFNVVTLENDLKWVALEGDWGPNFKIERADAAIDWLTRNGIATRGHVLIWPGWNNLPKRLRELEGKPEQLKQEVADHIKGLATRMRGKLVAWDVMNEPFDNHDLMDILGKDVMIDWFKIAREADPEAQLFINDYAILSGGGGTTPHRDHYEETIRFLLDGGAPLDAIGMQGHFGSTLTSPEDLLILLDRYAQFGKPIWITEFDVVIDDQELAGQYTRDFYTTLFSHPAVEGIVMWGFWDRIHWKGNAVMYAKDLSLKPGGQAYIDLVKQAWHTDVRGKSDPSGAFSTRGFLGKYTVAVSAGGKSRQVTADLSKGGSQIVVKLD